MAPPVLALVDLPRPRRYVLESGEAASVVIDLGLWRRRDEASMADDGRQLDRALDEALDQDDQAVAPEAGARQGATILKPTTGNFSRVAEDLRREREERERIERTVQELLARQRLDDAEREERERAAAEAARVEAIRAEIEAELRASGKLADDASMPALPAIAASQAPAPPVDPRAISPDGRPSQWAVDAAHVLRALPTPAAVILVLVLAYLYLAKQGII